MGGNWISFDGDHINLAQCNVVYEKRDEKKRLIGYHIRHLDRCISILIEDSAAREKRGGPGLYDSQETIDRIERWLAANQIPKL